MGQATHTMTDRKQRGMLVLGLSPPLSSSTGTPVCGMVARSPRTDLLLSVNAPWKRTLTHTNLRGFSIQSS